MRSIKENMAYKNKEQEKAYHKQYYIANKEEIACKQRKYHIANKEKIIRYGKKYEAANKEKRAGYNKKYSDTHREELARRGKEYHTRPEVRTRILKKKYGITIEEYDNLLCGQGGCCAICRLEPETACPNKPILNVDHNHKTGQVRGLLCNNCNAAIGYLKEDQDTLANASWYLLHGSELVNRYLILPREVK